MTTAIDLRGFELFSHFGDETLERLAECVSRQRYGPGSTLIQEGDRTTESYLISEGAVEVTRQTPFGTFDIARLGPGELLGELSYTDAEVRSGEARTAVATEAFVFDPILLTAACERSRDFELALHWTLWKSLSAKLRATNERLAGYFGEESAAPIEAVEPAALADAGAGDRDLEARRTLFGEQPLSGMEINFLATLSREERFAPGDLIFRQGDAGAAMYVVVDGQVVISTRVPGAGEEALAFLDRGEFFGEMALIDDRPRSADAKAHPDRGAVVLNIPAEVAGGILDLGQVSSLRLLKILCRLAAKRVRQIDEKLLGWFLLTGGEGTGIELPAAG